MSTRGASRYFILQGVAVTQRRRINEATEVEIPDELEPSSRVLVYGHGWRTDVQSDLYERGILEAAGELGAVPVGMVSRVPGQERTDFGGWHEADTWRRLPGVPLVLHSGAYRVAVDLISSGVAPPVIILLDALYGGTRQFAAYVDAGGTLVNVTSSSSQSTAETSDLLQSALELEPGRVVSSRYVRHVADVPHSDPAGLLRAAGVALDAMRIART